MSVNTGARGKEFWKMEMQREGRETHKVMRSPAYHSVPLYESDSEPYFQ